MNRSEFARACLVVAAVTAAVATAPTAPRARAKYAPPPTWEPDVLELFFADAFQVVGPLDELSAAEATRSEQPPESESTTTRPVAAASGEAAVDAFAWSELISPEALEGEIKATVARITPHVRSPGAFLRGQEELRQQCALLAALLNVAAQYDGSIRWHAEAAAMRDTVARMAAAEDPPADDAFAAAKLVGQQLEDLVRGAAIDAGTGAGKVAWAEISSLAALMKRLELAQQERLEPFSGSAAEFRRHRDDVLHEAALVAAVAEVISDESFEFAVEESYRAYAAELKSAAMRVTAAAQAENADAAADAVRSLGQTCTACHAEYR